MLGKDYSLSYLLFPIFFFLIVRDDIGLQWNLYYSEANLSTSLPVPWLWHSNPFRVRYDLLCCITKGFVPSNWNWNCNAWKLYVFLLQKCIKYFTLDLLYGLLQYLLRIAIIPPLVKAIATSSFHFANCFHTGSVSTLHSVRQAQAQSALECLTKIRRLLKVRTISMQIL